MCDRDGTMRKVAERGGFRREKCMVRRMGY
jgi:hypothetical protein